MQINEGNQRFKDITKIKPENRTTTDNIMFYQKLKHQEEDLMGGQHEDVMDQQGMVQDGTMNMHTHNILPTGMNSYADPNMLHGMGNNHGHGHGNMNSNMNMMNMNTMNMNMMNNHGYGFDGSAVGNVDMQMYTTNVGMGMGGMNNGNGNIAHENVQQYLTNMHNINEDMDHMHHDNMNNIHMNINHLNNNIINMNNMNNNGHINNMGNMGMN